MIELLTAVGRFATIVVALMGLGLSVWLGLGLVARAPRRGLAWLGALLFWSFGLVHTLTLLQLGRPVVPSRPLLPFDLLRWLLIPLPLGWLWLVLALLPARLRPLVARYRLLALLGSLLVAGLTVVVGPFSLLAGLGGGRWGWLFYPGYLLLVPLVLGPLIPLAWRAGGMARLRAEAVAARALAVATALLLAAAVIGVAGFWYRFDFPRFPALALLLAAQLALGGAIVLAQEGRSGLHAFGYTLANAASITVIYALATGLAVALLDLPWLVLVTVVPLTVGTHWLVDWSRRMFDRLFYRAPIQRLRDELRALIQELGREGPLERPLVPLLARAAAGADARALALLEGDEPLARFPEEGELPPLTTARVVPLGGEGVALAAWPRGDAGASFDGRARGQLDEIAAQLAALLAGREAQRRRLDEIEALATEYREQAAALGERLAALTDDPDAPIPLDTLEREARDWIEAALRRLHDVGFLGELPLARLTLVERAVAPSEGGITRLDRGRALREQLEGLVARLRPESERPPEPLPAEWRLYAVIHDAYFEGEPNREIMSRLYISRTTFHRARRAALDALAGALIELEREARRLPETEVIDAAD